MLASHENRRAVSAAIDGPCSISQQPGGAAAQGLSGDVNDDLLPIGAGRGEHVVREEALGDAGESVGPPGAEGDNLPGRKGRVVVVHGHALGGDVERLHDERAHLGGQVAGEDERPVIVVSKGDAPALLLPLLARQLLGFLTTTIGMHQSLHMRGGAVLGDGQQAVLVVLVADA